MRADEAGGLRHPVEGDVGQQLVLGEHRLGIAVAVAPGAELLDDPRRQRHRRVVERDADGLRLGALDLLVAGLFGSERSGGSSAARSRPPISPASGSAPAGAGAGAHVQVQAGDVRRVAGRHLRPDDRAPVAALHAVAARSRAAPSAPLRAGRSAPGPSRARAAPPRSRTRESTASRRRRRRRRRRRAPTGSVSGPMIFVNSAIEPGQPWVTSSGRAPGCRDRRCTKCTVRPSMVVVNCSSALSRRSCARQSNESRQ